MRQRDRHRRRSGPGEAPAALRKMSLPAVEDLGVDFLREGHLTAALFCLREAMERGTRNGEVRQSYVHAMLLLFTEAEADNLRKRLRGEPAGEALDTRETWNSLVLLSADNARDWPEDPHNHLLHGMCLARVGRYGEALAAYERGLALDPSEEEVEELKTLLRQAEEALQR